MSHDCVECVVFGVKVRSAGCVGYTHDCRGQTHDFADPPKWVRCECYCHSEPK